MKHYRIDYTYIDPDCNFTVGDNKRLPADNPSHATVKFWEWASSLGDTSDVRIVDVYEVDVTGRRLP